MAARPPEIKLITQQLEAEDIQPRCLEITKRLEKSQNSKITKQNHSLQTRQIGTQMIYQTMTLRDRIHILYEKIEITQLQLYLG